MTGGGGVAIVIPARYASTRYPAKPLALLRGAGGAAKPLIQRSWEAARGVPGVARVIVATDDARIAEAARRFGAEVAMTPASCANGTERCAAVLPMLDEGTEIVVNLQGDALLTPPEFILALIAAMREDAAVNVATPALRCSPELQRRLLVDHAAGRVGGTTVARDAGGDALYFSKAVIPYLPPTRVGNPDLPLFFHVGAYAYRPAALRAYAAAPPATLEQLEGLEQLRFLERRLPVRVVEVEGAGYDLWELNNPEDAPVIEAALARRGIA